MFQKFLYKVNKNECMLNQITHQNIMGLKQKIPAIAFGLVVVTLQ